MAALMKRALDGGLYLMTHWNVVMCCPPLTITRDELDEALAILDDALTVADEYCRLGRSPRRRARTSTPATEQVVVDPRFHVTVSKNRKWANVCRLDVRSGRGGGRGRAGARAPARRPRRRG